MSPTVSSNQTDEPDGSEVLRRHNRSERNVTRGTLLALAEDENVTKALRLREDAFNEDVLPARAELKAPQDFYAAIEAERVMRSQQQPSPEQIACHKGQCPFLIWQLEGQVDWRTAACKPRHG
ncbi:hypothetical protein [Bradyrhizobium sp. UFLA05-112]